MAQPHASDRRQAEVCDRALAPPGPGVVAGQRGDLETDRFLQIPCGPSADLPSQRFARGRARNLVDRPELDRDLEQREPAQAETAKFLGIEAIRNGNHERHRHLAKLVVVPADDERVPHSRRRHQHRLDLQRVHVLPTTNDHVVDSAVDEQPAVVEPARVSGAVPAIHD